MRSETHSGWRHSSHPGIVKDDETTLGTDLWFWFKVDQS